MFRDVQGLPFITEGVTPDVIRAGEPRLLRFRGDDAPAPVRAAVSRRVPRWVLRAVTP